MTTDDTALSRQYGPELLDLAGRSIAHGLASRSPLPVDLDRLPPALHDLRATFVTLRIGAGLRGCMGTLEARLPLAEDIAGNAYSAAFRDPRFSPLTEEEFPQLSISLSILSQAAEIEFHSEDDLLARLQPGIDGLILRVGSRRGLLLPAVWKMFPEPERFLAQLKKKAGLPEDFWSEELVCERFTAVSIS